MFHPQFLTSTRGKDWTQASFILDSPYILKPTEQSVLDLKRRMERSTLSRYSAKLSYTLPLSQPAVNIREARVFQDLQCFGLEHIPNK